MILYSQNKKIDSTLKKGRYLVQAGTKITYKIRSSPQRREWSFLALIKHCLKDIKIFWLEKIGGVYVFGRKWEVLRWGSCCPLLTNSSEKASEGALRPIVKFKNMKIRGRFGLKGAAALRGRHAFGEDAYFT